MQQQPKPGRRILVRPALIRKGRPVHDKKLDPLMRALKAIHSATAPESMTPAELERERRGQEVLGRLAAPMVGISWQPFDLAGMPAAWARPSRVHDTRHVILYCHGGGYTSGNLGYSRVLASKLAHAGTWWWPATPPGAIWPWCSAAASRCSSAASPPGWSSFPPGPT